MKAHAAFALTTLLLIPPILAQQNLLPQGDFEGGLAPWNSHEEKGAKRSQRAEATPGARGERAARITVEIPGQSNHVQFTCPFESEKLEPGEIYRLTFLARSEPSRDCTVHLLGADRPWTNAGLRREIALSADWQFHDLVFRARDPKQERVKVDFFLGDIQGDVWLDDVSLIRAEVTDRPLPTGPKMAGRDWALTFSETGSVGALVYSPTQTQLVGGSEAAPAYELLLRRGEETRRISSAAALSVETSGDDASRTFVFTHDEQIVRCAERRTDGDLIEFSASVGNTSDWAIEGMRYPILHCPARLGADSADDVILYPRCDGGIIEDPLATMDGGALDELYPGPLSCQVMSFYDPSGGLYVAAHDPDGNPKKLGVSMGVDLEISVTHLWPLRPGEDVAVGYPVVLGAFRGDWYDAAEIYRQWAHRQSWCASPLSDRPDMPQWLKRGGMVTMHNPRARKGDGTFRFSPDGLREFCEMLRDTYALPVISNNRGWERRGEWCGQEYLPPFPDEERFREDAAILRDAGGQGMIMLSGWRWTIEKPQPDGSLYDASDRFEREVKPFVTYAPDGLTPLVSASTKQDDWHGTRYARMCPATDFAKKTVTDIARHCVEAGYSVIHFDQEVSGPASTSLCYSPNHGHPPGYGPWMTKAMAEQYQQIRAACEPLDADFVLSMEEPNELFLPWLNLCQERPNGLTSEFPIRAPMTRVVPLFSYLYHDYLVGWCAFYPWRSMGQQTYSLAKGFSAGVMPGLHHESLARWPQEAQDRFNTLLRRCNKAYADEAREYLIFGRMLKPFALEVPARELNLGEKHRKITVPAVSNSVWEAPDGSRACILINPENTDHEVRIPGRRPVTVPALDVVVVEL